MRAACTPSILCLAVAPGCQLADTPWQTYCGGLSKLLGSVAPGPTQIGARPTRLYKWLTDPS